MNRRIVSNIRYMRYLILYLLILFPLSSFAWLDNGCKPLTVENSCIVVCYINANVAITKIHEGFCKTNNETPLYQEKKDE